MARLLRNEVLKKESGAMLDEAEACLREGDLEEIVEPH